jgi:hypothetical protein
VAGFPESSSIRKALQSGSHGAKVLLKLESGNMALHEALYLCKVFDDSDRRFHVCKYGIPDMEGYQRQLCVSRVVDVQALVYRLLSSGILRPRSAEGGQDPNCSVRGEQNGERRVKEKGHPEGSRRGSRGYDGALDRRRPRSPSDLRYRVSK